ncbi:MAG: AMP-binding enzyme, partial [Vicinamibacterales bacterium]
DSDGFLRITDRLSRFSKIGGEMVPHLNIEDAINRVLGDTSSVVTSIPDEQRGERLVAFYVKPDLAAAELWKQLAETGLPNLWIPKRENLYSIDALPLLASGKLDLKTIRDLAVRLAAA